MPIQMNYYPYVNIIVKDKNIEILTGGVTDDKSPIKIIKIPLGKIQLRFNLLEIQERKVNFTATIARYDIGNVRLSIDVSELNEVTEVVEISAIIQKIN